MTRINRATRPTKTTPQLDSTAAVILSEIMEPFHEMSLEDAASSYYGLGRLIEHHPALQRESRAMLQLSQSEDVIKQFLLAMEKL